MYLVSLKPTSNEKYYLVTFFNNIENIFLNIRLSVIKQDNEISISALKSEDGFLFTDANEILNKLEYGTVNNIDDLFIIVREFLEAKGYVYQPANSNLP